MNKHLHRLVFSSARGACIAVAETVASTGKAASGERRSGRHGAAATCALGLAIAAFGAQAQSVGGVGAAAGTFVTGVAPKASVQTGNVLPTGGVVVKGSGSIQVSGADMTINQASQRLVANWQSFSIGSGNSVRFVQPSSSAVALNRVTGDDASRIFGSLTANGHVYLENANGVYFAPGAQVSVGSLLATTLHVDDDQFMQGNLRLSGGSTSLGEVSNGGSIVAAPGGTVILAGPVVSNTGAIVTPGGTTALVAANAVNVDPTGSGLLNISVPVAAVNASLVQSGSIAADGGSVQLAAAATDAALRTVMQVDGVVRARSIESRNGSIVLSGGSSGIVAVTGQLDVSGHAGMSGGTIEVLGERVGLMNEARLDASGSAGGGTVLVGGNRQGNG
ncbi:MAG TPA: filamentous hemagglutinin N-terminal domain-containing protein, partial [Caldimonas sp.]|nr:filamentous hemagglutinin N-terminal domain-containing protein [Caldimonas sp.]